MAKDLWNTDIDVSAWDDVLTQWFERYWDAFVDPDSGIIYDNPPWIEASRSDEMTFEDAKVFLGDASTSF